MGCAAATAREDGCRTSPPGAGRARRPRVPVRCRSISCCEPLRTARTANADPMPQPPRTRARPLCGFHAETVPRPGRRTAAAWPAASEREPPAAARASAPRARLCRPGSTCGACDAWNSWCGGCPAAPGPAVCRASRASAASHHAGDAPARAPRGGAPRPGQYPGGCLPCAKCVRFRARTSEARHRFGIRGGLAPRHRTRAAARPAWHGAPRRRRPVQGDSAAVRLRRSTRRHRTRRAGGG